MGMEKYPRNIMEFEKRFKSEEACRKYLFKIRWPDGYNCPRCKHSKTWIINGQLYKCSNCGYRSSVTAGTMFQDTKKPLRLCVAGNEPETGGLVRWGCSEPLVSVVIIPLGSGCTDLDMPWFVPDETVLQE